MNNSATITDWIEHGGVLGYVDQNLYIMDEGEFSDRFREYSAGHSDITPAGLDQDNFAKLLCKSALQNTGFDRQIQNLMYWEV